MTTKQHIEALTQRMARYQNVGRKAKPLHANRSAFSITKPNAFLIELGKKGNELLTDEEAIKAGIAIYRKMLKEDE
jgi:hypothetical protein